MVEGTRLESVRCGNVSAGSNPALSAKLDPTEPVNKVWLGAFSEVVYRNDFICLRMWLKKRRQAENRQIQLLCRLRYSFGKLPVYFLNVREK